MKQNKLITLIVLTITVICSSLPLQGQTKLYNQYKHRTDMVVMCVMDYPITDSLKTDITMFMPKTKEDLWPMVQEFGLGLDKDTVYNRFEKETTLLLRPSAEQVIYQQSVILSSPTERVKVHRTDLATQHTDTELHNLRIK